MQGSVYTNRYAIAYNYMHTDALLYRLSLHLSKYLFKPTKRIQPALESFTKLKQSVSLCMQTIQAYKNRKCWISLRLLENMEV